MSNHLRFFIILALSLIPLINTAQAAPPIPDNQPVLLAATEAQLSGCTITAYLYAVNDYDDIRFAGHWSCGNTAKTVTWKVSAFQGTRSLGTLSGSTYSSGTSKGFTVYCANSTSREFTSGFRATISGVTKDVYVSKNFTAWC